MTPDAPTPPPRTPEAPRAPDTGASQGDADKRRRRRRASGSQSRGGTILTSPTGVQSQGATGSKTLLGQ